MHHRERKDLNLGIHLRYIVEISNIILRGIDSSKSEPHEFIINSELQLYQLIIEVIAYCPTTKSEVVLVK